jgi:hypothetical protein
MNFYCYIFEYDYKNKPEGYYDNVRMETLKEF